MRRIPSEPHPFFAPSYAPSCSFALPALNLRATRRSFLDVCEAASEIDEIAEADFYFSGNGDAGVTGYLLFVLFVLLDLAGEQVCSRTIRIRDVTATSQRVAKRGQESWPGSVGEERGFGPAWATRARLLTFDRTPLRFQSSPSTTTTSLVLISL